MTLKLKTRTQSRVTRTITASVTEAVQLGLAGLAHKIGEPIPDTARIAVQVPGGGDYSNMSLDGPETELTISWSFEEGGEDEA